MNMNVNIGGEPTPAVAILDGATRLPVQFPSSLGGKDPSGSLPVTFSSDVSFTSAAYAALNTDLLTGVVNGWYDAKDAHSVSLQIIASAGISAGAIVFEATNDTANASAGVVYLVEEDTNFGSAAPLSGVTISASTVRMFVAAIKARYIRVRISTAFVGGTVQVAAVFSQLPYSRLIQTVAQSTSGNLAMTPTLSVAGTTLTNDVGIQPRATTGGLTLIYRLLSALATTNPASVKSSAGRIYKIYGLNTSATVKWLKIHNKASAPTVGTDAPVVSIPLAASKEFSIDIGPIGQYCSLGVAIAITGGGADADTTALTAGDIVGLNIWYI